MEGNISAAIWILCSKDLPTELKNANLAKVSTLKLADARPLPNPSSWTSSMQLLASGEILYWMQLLRTPEIYRFAYVKYTCKPKLIYGLHFIWSKVGSLQGDPLSSLEFCDVVDLTLNSEMCPSFIDDVSLFGHISTVSADVKTIIAADAETWLHLNLNKCEIIGNDLNIVDTAPENQGP